LAGGNGQGIQDWPSINMLTASNIVRISNAAMPRFDQLSQESAPRLTCEVRLLIDSSGSNAPSCARAAGRAISSAHVSILRAEQRAEQ
jgi:hypothetical protein